MGKYGSNDDIAYISQAFSQNAFLTSKVHSFRKMGLTINIECTSNSSLVQVIEVVNWPYITKVTAKSLYVFEKNLNLVLS